MLYSLSQEIHPPLTFDEASIITFNIYGTKDVTFLSLDDFLFRMETLCQNTSDPFLRRTVQSIQTKISKLSVAEYEQLCKDCASGKLVFPPNYIPSNAPRTNEE